MIKNKKNVGNLVFTSSAKSDETGSGGDDEEGYPVILQTYRRPGYQDNGMMLQASVLE